MAYSYDTYNDNIECGIEILEDGTTKAENYKL